MNLSDLQKKEIIDIATGRRVGSIIDVIVSSCGSIQKLILEDRRSAKRFLNNSKDEFSLDWKQIIKIGDDIILIDGKKEIDY